MGGGQRSAQLGLDENILDQLRRVGGEALVEELIRLFTTHTPERMRRARRALAGGDLKRAARAVHSLRSSSATLGAGELAKALGKIEAAADRGDGETVSRDWPGIEDDVEALLSRLGERLAES